MSIGDLSRRTGTNIETIRYYERIGMLPPARRTESGRRIYNSSDERVLAFIRRGRAIGFTLPEIRALLDLGAPTDAQCEDVREVASAHLANVRVKLADLIRLESILADAVAECAGGAVPECPVLDILDPADGPRIGHQTTA